MTLTILLFAAMVVADAASDVLVARAMKQIGEVSDFRPRALIVTFGRMVRTPSFVAGIGSAAVHFFTFLALLSFIDLSTVFPATALVYVLATTGAWLVLKEYISPRRWAGVWLVCGGMILVTMT
ncbi:EamA domain-containing protein [Azospirillaceae bacterium]